MAVCVTPVVPVGNDGVPVKVGEARGAKPEMLAPAGIVTVPVNVGEARGAAPEILLTKIEPYQTHPRLRAT